MAVLQAGRLVAADDRLSVVSAAVAGLAFLVAVPLIGRDVRRAERFLRAHPADVDAPG
jgi:hypothetical protein